MGLKGSFAELFPMDLAQVESVIGFYGSSMDKVHFISTGYNWGMGSKHPPYGKSIVVNLCNLKSISNFDEELGYIKIEPGVTQADLVEYLNDNSKKWYLDVTGSGCKTSILGNSLERGIGYKKCRVDLIKKLSGYDKESNRMVGTGYNMGSRIDYAYPWGVGPDRTGMFYQTDSIVTLSAVVKLLRLPEKRLSFNIYVDENNIELVTDVLRDLWQRRILTNNTHLASPERIRGLLGPQIKIRTDESYDEITANMNKILKNKWIGSACIEGDKEIVRRKYKLVVKAFKGLAKCKKQRDIPSVVNFLPNKGVFAVLKTLKVISPELHKYGQGIPSDIGLPSVLWSPSITTAEINKLLSTKDLDSCEVGSMFCAPVLPMNGNGLSRFNAVINSVSDSYDFVPAITINYPTDSFCELVINVTYKKTADNYKRASVWMDELETKLLKCGGAFYRKNVFQKSQGSEIVKSTA